MLTKEFFSHFQVLTAHTTTTTRKKAKKFFIHKILYAPMWKYWREKSIFRFFGALFFSLYAMLSLKHTHTHTSFSLLTHTPTYVFFSYVATWKRQHLYSQYDFFSRISSQHKIIFVSPFSQWKVLPTSNQTNYLIMVLFAVLILRRYFPCCCEMVE